MYMFFGILFFLMGLSMIAFPKIYFDLQKWKMTGKATPSKRYIIHNI